MTGAHGQPTFRYAAVAGVFLVVASGFAAYVLYRYARSWHTDVAALAALPYAEPGDWPYLVYVEFDGVVMGSWERTKEVELAIAAPGDFSCPIQVFVPKATWHAEKYIVGSQHVFAGRIMSGHLVKPTALDYVQVTSDRLMPVGRAALVVWSLAAVTFVLSLAVPLVRRRRLRTTEPVQGRSLGSGGGTEGED